MLNFHGANCRDDCIDWFPILLIVASRRPEEQLALGGPFQRSAEQRQQQVFAVEEAPHEHVAVVDGLATLEVRAPRPPVQEAPHAGVRGRRGCLAPPDLRPCAVDMGL